MRKGLPLLVLLLSRSLYLRFLFCWDATGLLLLYPLPADADADDDDDDLW